MSRLTTGILGLLFFLGILPSGAQELQLTDARWVASDTEAMDRPHYDGNKKQCALLKVFVSDLPGVVFGSGYILYGGTDTYDGECYRLYVSPGMYRMQVKHADYGVLPVDVKQDYGFRFEPGKTYHLQLAVPHRKSTQTVLFQVYPPDSRVVFGDRSLTASKGMLSVELEPGMHAFTVAADCFHSFSGELSVVENPENPLVVPVKLKPELSRIPFACNAAKAVLFVDGVAKGGTGEKELPLGRHHIRVVADGWNDYSDYVVLANGSTLHVELKAKLYVKMVVKAPSSALDLYVDNKKVEMWSNGRPFKVKTGRHLLTVVLSSKDVVEKIVNVTPDMEPVSVY